MRDSVKKVLLLSGIAAAVAGMYAVRHFTQEVDFSHKYEGYDLAADVEGAVREGTYTNYQLAHADAAYPQQTIEIPLLDYVSAKDVEVTNEYEDAVDALYTGSESEVTWEVNVPETGYYQLEITYMTVPSRGVAIERAVYINGELPFDDAGNITFGRIWKDGSAKRVDNQGNEIRPSQVEEYQWQTAYCRDDMGYIVEPYQFYLEEGSNTVTFEGVNEPMVLSGATFTPVSEQEDYQTYLAGIEGTAAQGEGLSFTQVLQGEDAARRSESSLYGKYDRSSPSTQPYSVMHTVLNYTGGDAWSSAGQWIEWDVEVPEDGYYHITVKGRQNYSRGSVSTRSLSIDGEIPFAEAAKVNFEYDNDWKLVTLSDEEGEPYDFYLTKGVHTLRLEASLGDMGSILEEIEDSTYRLNQLYRKILVYTGATPDKYRDYNIDTLYPEVIEAMSLESKRLYRIVDEVVTYTGQKADKIATAQTLAQQLERFAERPEKITLEFTNFKDNITALGTAALNMSETKLDVDYLVVTGENTKPEADESGALAKLWHEVRSFAASYVVDYDSVGDVYDEDEDVVKVWVLTGRDQGTILKSMVDDTFTPETGIKVNVEIVGADALLNAVLAGRGPNVVLSVGADQPVNYALRNAAEDLSQFEDLDQVLSSYTESTYEQYRLGDSVYAIPETQGFNVMFYRKDVLEELELEVPETWQELIEMLPTIQGNNMSVAIPTAAGSSSTGSASTAIAANTPDLSLYFTLLFQNGGDLYNEAGTNTTVDEEAGVEAFEEYTKYFTDYGIPTIYDFVSRFRSGEMPIGLANYTVYNTLVVSAPEIRGLWDFTVIPGTERVDENGNVYIDHSDFVSGSATMMIKTEEESVREKSWEFMKWWAQADTQVRFGREIEALLGSSARYATANVDAFNQLAWSADDIEVLSKQWQQTVGIREVPGGYYTGRHITNAIRKVINEQTDPRETIIDYSITIDEEIAKKRTEFGMSVE